MTEEQNRMMVYWMEQTLAGYVHEGNNLEATKLRIQLEPFQKREAERQEKVLRAQQLFTAIKTGDMDTFNKLLEDGIDVNQEESIAHINPNRHRKLTPLIFAIKNRQFEMVKLLLLKDSIDPNKQYPLQALTMIEHNRNCTFQQRKQISEAVQLLVDHPEINVNIQDDNGCTPLVYACRAGFYDLVKCLLNHINININFIFVKVDDNDDDRQTRLGQTALMMAVSHRKIYTAMLFLQHKTHGPSLGTNKENVHKWFGIKEIKGKPFEFENIDNYNVDNHNEYSTNGRISLYKYALEVEKQRVQWDLTCPLNDEWFGKRGLPLIRYKERPVFKTCCPIDIFKKIQSFILPSREVQQTLLLCKELFTETINEKSQNGFTQLYQSVMENNIDDVKVLLTVDGINVNELCNNADEPNNRHRARRYNGDEIEYLDDGQDETALDLAYRIIDQVKYNTNGDEEKMKMVNIFMELVRAGGKKKEEL